MSKNNFKKFLIIHADDTGMCFSHNQATKEGLLKGTISSCSLMAPCPWFYEMVHFFKNNNHLDYGVHLTLTGEWKKYPFRPLSPKNDIKSLVDNFGNFHSDRQSVKKYSKSSEVYLELKNQINYFLNLGLEPSHLDSHMYTLALRQDLIDVYKRLGDEFNLPILMHSDLNDHIGENLSGFDYYNIEYFDNIYMASYKNFINEGIDVYYDGIIDNLKNGISMILIHPAKRSEEIDEITIDHPNFGSKWREIDYKYFTSKDFKKRIKNNNIKIVSWKNFNLYA
jgi:predicted glycoside hydrolase/deacetylase ChbG (UPF0249 family)